MKFFNRAKFENLQIVTSPKGIFLQIEEIERSYRAELKLKLKEHNELLQLEYDLEAEMKSLSQQAVKTLAEIKSLSQQAMETLADISRKSPPSMEEHERNDQDFEKIKQSLKNQDFDVFTQKQIELEKAIERKVAVKSRCDEIEKYLAHLNQARAESEALIEDLRRERDEILQSNTLLQENVKQLQDGHRHEIERLDNDHNQKIKILNDKIIDLASSNNKVHLTKMRNDLLQKSQLTFYIALISSIIGLVFTGMLVISIISDKSTRDSNSLVLWERIVAVAASLTTQGFGAAIFRMKKRYYEQSIDLSEKLEKLDREEQINEHIYKLLEMLKEPQIQDAVREQIQKCIDEMHLLREKQDSSIIQPDRGSKK